jgi:hypothetical protein
MRPRLAAVLLVTLGVAVSACGVETPPEELFAVHLGDREGAAGSGVLDGAGLTDLGDGEGEALDLPAVAAGKSVEPDEGDDPSEADAGTPAPEPEPAPEQEPAVTSDNEANAARAPSGPSDGDVARFVAAQKRDAVESGHHVADLTGNGVVDVAVGRRTVDGTVEVVLGVWDGSSLVHRGTATAGAGGTALGGLVARDLDGDGRPELLLPYTVRPHRAVLVAVVRANGDLVVPTGCPVGAPASYSLDFGHGADPVRLACSRREARGGDALVWDGDRFGGSPAEAAAAPRGRGR